MAIAAISIPDSKPFKVGAGALTVGAAAATVANIGWNPGKVASLGIAAAGAVIGAGLVAGLSSGGPWAALSSSS